jgi:ribosomal protein S18 acetylase RimI-like enzyme
MRPRSSPCGPRCLATPPPTPPDAVIRHKLAVQRELFLVARLDGCLAGTVMGGYDGHRGWVYSLALRPDLRRPGVETALMLHVERELASRGCPKVNLQVLATNAATVAFYEKLGYSVEERVSMSKVLRPGAGVELPIDERETRRVPDVRLRASR